MSPRITEGQLKFQVLRGGMATLSTAMPLKLVDNGEDTWKGRFPNVPAELFKRRVRQLDCTPNLSLAADCTKPGEST